MAAGDPLELDVVIFGGGAAGLWLLDEMVHEGRRVLLLEANGLGSGQTIASQGIIHGGLKYSLDGLLTPSAREVRDMPILWRRALAGERKPNLAATRRRAEYCLLWQTGSLTSRLAMFGARKGLRVDVIPLEPAARPVILRECPGLVARLDEQVIDPESFVIDFAGQHSARLLKIDPESGLEFVTSGRGRVDLVRLINPDSGDPLDLRPRHVVFTAGAGNEGLAARVGLVADGLQQRRPLQMVVARGALPVLNGHCVDGAQPCVTITTSRDYADRTIWQIGGRVAEEGASQERDEVLRCARRELERVLPGIDLSGADWTTYRVDRAEGVIRGGRRPVHECLAGEGNTIVGWPTKLVLAPRLAARVRERLGPPAGLPAPENAALEAWPRPEVAAPPWEEDPQWSTVV